MQNLKPGFLTDIIFVLYILELRTTVNAAMKQIYSLLNKRRSSIQIDN
jgi:hypothetical protein